MGSRTKNSKPPTLIEFYIPITLGLTCRFLEVPCTTAQRLRLGGLEESGVAMKGTTDLECSDKTPSWKKNCSRAAWNYFYKMKLGWRVKQNIYRQDDGDGNILEIPYVPPKELLQFLMTNQPDVLVGGFDCPSERAQHIAAFWEGFRLHHGDHLVYQEHEFNLPYVLPLLWHGDEGRGKRRGQTVLVSLEVPIGIETVKASRKRARETCRCDPPMSLKQKYGPVRRKVPQHMKKRLDMQKTNMKHHSFLQHFPIFIIPSSINKKSDALFGLLDVFARELKSLFYEGFESNGRVFCAAVCGGKGDLKWVAKIARLTRSFEHQGRTQDLACCHECLAGTPNSGMPWEDLSETPSWSTTRWLQRPWIIPPPMSLVPFSTLAEERQYKRDPFHLTKVGIFRDLVGSGTCYLARTDLFGAGSFDEKLDRCYSSFRLWCHATGHTPALRSFSRAFMNYPRFSLYPWANSKGSDTTLLLKWLVIQCTAFLNDSANNGCDVYCLDLIKKTSKAALNIFAIQNSHGLWLHRECGMALYAEYTRFTNGYAALANYSLNDFFSGWGMKPKLHLVKHAALELHEWLGEGLEYLPNFNLHNTEQNEDQIGRVCRLSRRIDSRHVGQRVLDCCYLKSGLLHRRFKKGL